jgi:intermediate peptidase
LTTNEENVTLFLNSLSAANYPLAEKEFKSLLEIKRNIFKQKNVDFEAWDRYYYSQFIEPQFNQKAWINNPRASSGISSYFSVGTVFAGLSNIFQSLYGVRFEIEDVLPGEVWHPNVRKLAVVHETEGIIGTIYCDLFQREPESTRKYDNAAHFTVRCCRRIDNDEVSAAKENWRMHNDKHERIVIDKNGDQKTYQLPIVVLVTSFKFPSNDGPCLLDTADIETLFHEMGHAMHSMLSQTDFQHISGTRVAMDFVEVPSILMEYFAKSPKILSNLGVHYKTLERIPIELIEARQERQNYLNALENQNQFQMAMLDQAYHSDLANNDNFNTSEIMYALSSKVNPLPIPRPSKWQVQFSHLFTYGASYYSYAWSRRWASRIFRKHFEHKRQEEWRIGGEILRHEVLGCGGGRDPWIGLEKIGVINDEEQKSFYDTTGIDITI